MSSQLPQPMTAYEKIMKVGGWALNKPSGVDGASRKYGMSEKTVHQLSMTLKRATPEVIEAVKDSVIGARHAYELSKLTHDQQTTMLRPAMTMSVAQLQKHLQESSPENLILEPKGIPLDDTNIRSVAERIEERLGVSIDMYWVDRKRRLMLKVVATGFPAATRFLNRFGVQILDAPIDISASHFSRDLGHVVRMHFKFEGHSHFVNHLYKVLDRLMEE